MDINIDRLEFVFGPESSGGTPDARARSSTRKFIRSQDHLSLYDEKRHAGSAGRIISAYEAYKYFEIGLLEEAIEKGTAIIAADLDEPARTIEKRRTQLGLEIEDIVKYAPELSRDDLISAENSGTRTPIRKVDKICQVLGLDEGVISLKPDAGGDKLLAVRLKKLLTADRDENRFGPKTVLAFDEAGWVIATQMKLWRWLHSETRAPRWETFVKEPDYGSPLNPAYEIGYRLARKTREILGVPPSEPIRSVRKLCEEMLNIPLIQAELPHSIAGATIVNSGCRGIIANRKGNNRNVWTRRITIAHELGHLLWDPDEELDRIRVDNYDSLEKDTRSGDNSDRRYYVEQRAGAFSVEFLAPRSAVMELFLKKEDLREVMTTFGISYTAAKYHVWHALDRSIPLEDLKVADWEPGQDWLADENYAGDYFPIKGAPIIKTGNFAGLVVRAEEKGLISEDTAAQYLSCSREEYMEGKELIAELYPSS